MMILRFWRDRLLAYFYNRVQQWQFIRVHIPGEVSTQYQYNIIPTSVEMSILCYIWVMIIGRSVSGIAVFDQIMPFSVTTPLIHFFDKQAVITLDTVL